MSWVTTQPDCVITKLNTGKTRGKKVKPKMAGLLISFLLLTGTVARWQESIRPKMVVDYLKQHAGKKIRDLNSIIAVWWYGYNSQHSWRSNDKVWSPRVTNGCSTNHFSTGVVAISFTQSGLTKLTGITEGHFISPHRLRYSCINIFGCLRQTIQNITLRLSV